MGAYKYLMIHCTATVQGAKLNHESIQRMHMGAKKLPDGRIQYKGVKYDSISDLPNEQLGGVHSTKTNGRGWDRVGYSQIFFEDGASHKFVEHNGDNWISADEITYGAVGFNNVTKHFVYAGGLAKSYTMIGGKINHDFKNTMSTAQEWELICAVKKEIRENPNVKIIGHNQTAVKGCPCFDVREWCRLVGIPEQNIDTRNLLVNLKNETTSNHGKQSTPFKNKSEGDKFRQWVNYMHREYAKEIDLDESGSHTNAYIMKAWKKLGTDYQAFITSASS